VPCGLVGPTFSTINGGSFGPVVKAKVEQLGVTLGLSPDQCTEPSPDDKNVLSMIEALASGDETPQDCAALIVALKNVLDLTPARPDAIFPWREDEAIRERPRRETVPAGESRAPAAASPRQHPRRQGAVLPAMQAIERQREREAAEGRS